MKSTGGGCISCSQRLFAPLPLGLHAMAIMHCSYMRAWLESHWHHSIAALCAQQISQLPGNCWHNKIQCRDEWKPALFQRVTLGVSGPAQPCLLLSQGHGRLLANNTTGPKVGKP